MLWHITRDEFLVRDFLENWLFPAYDAGAFRVRTEEVERYLDGIGKRGAITEHAWSEETTKRVAAGLLKIAVDLVSPRERRQSSLVHRERAFFTFCMRSGTRTSAPAKSWELSIGACS